MVKDKAITEFKGEYAFLSNFYRHDGRITAEHLFQSMKTDNPIDQLWILAAPTPAEAKMRGRQATLRDDWEEVKIGVMECILAIKFAYGTLMSYYLEKTGNTYLIEGNWWGDKFWGAVFTPEGGTIGQNWLGQLLMERRKRNREE